MYWNVLKSCVVKKLTYFALFIYNLGFVMQVDTDASPYLAKAENVDFVPTFKIYKNGVKVMELPGPTEQALENALGQLCRYY